MTRARTGLYLIGDKDNPSRFLAEIDDYLLNNISESSIDYVCECDNQLF